MAAFSPSRDDDDVRDEAPSPRRRAEARRAGDVPRSPVFTGWVMLMALWGALLLVGPALLQAFAGLLTSSLRAAGQGGGVGRAGLDGVGLNGASLDKASLDWGGLDVTGLDVTGLGGLIALVLAVLLLAAILAPWLLSGWVWVRASAGSARRGEHGGKAYHLVRIGLAVLVASSLVVLASATLTPVSLQADAASLPGLVAGWGRTVLVWLLTALAGLAVIDAGWVWGRWWQRHRMSRRELDAEAHDAEADPAIRAALRQRALGRRSPR